LLQGNERVIALVVTEPYPFVLTFEKWPAGHRGYASVLLLQGNERVIALVVNRTLSLRINLEKWPAGHRGILKSLPSPHLPK
jgi:hypothetical protein